MTFSLSVFDTKFVFISCVLWDVCSALIIMLIWCLCCVLYVNGEMANTLLFFFFEGGGGGVHGAPNTPIFLPSLRDDNSSLYPYNKVWGGILDSLGVRVYV
jgi:hypothetical protein